MSCREVDASRRSATLIQRNTELTTELHQAQKTAATLQLRLERLQAQLLTAQRNSAAAAATNAAAAAPAAVAAQQAAAAAAESVVTQLSSELSQIKSELASTQSRAARAELELAVARTKMLVAQQVRHLGFLQNSRQLQTFVATSRVLSRYTWLSNNLTLPQYCTRP